METSVAVRQRETARGDEQSAGRARDARALRWIGRHQRWIVVALALGWVVAATTVMTNLDLSVPSHSAGYTLIVGAPTVLAVGLGVRAVSNTAGTRRRFWLLYSAGFASFMAGHLTQALFELLDSPAGGTGAHGIFYTLGLLVLLGALITRLNLVASNTWHVQVLDGATVALVVWSILFALIADRIVDAGSVAVWIQVIQPILVMWLFVGAVSLVLTPTPLGHNRSEIVMFVALFMGGVEAWLELYLLLETGTVIDLSSGALFTATLAVAAMAPAFESYGDVAPLRRDDYQTPLWPQLGVALMPFAALYAVLRAGLAAQIVVIAGMTGVFVLAILRQLEVLRAQRRLFDSERALTQAIERDASAARSLAGAARDLAATTDRKSSEAAVIAAGLEATDATVVRICDADSDARGSNVDAGAADAASVGRVYEAAFSGADAEGVAIAADGPDWRPSTSEEEVLQALTRLLATALERASLIESMSLSERRLRNLIDALPAAVVEVDSAGRLLTWNPEFEALTENSTDELRASLSAHGRGIGQRDLAEIALSTVAASSSDGPRLVEQEVSIATVTGKRRRLSYASRPMHVSERGQPTFLIVFWDETRRFEQQKRIVRLVQELESKKQSRSELLEQVITSTEDERRRLAAELHDGPVQTLTALGLRLDSLCTQMTETTESFESAKGRLGEARSELGRLVDTLRLASSELRPPALDQNGVGAALDELCRRLEAEYGLRCIADLAGAPTTNGSPVSNAAQTVIYRVGQEAMTNVVRHAEATEVRVFCGVRDSKLELVIADNGKGGACCDTSAIAELCAHGHYGIASMAERVGVLGGEFSIDSPNGRPHTAADGGGTTVRARIPLMPAVDA